MYVVLSPLLKWHTYTQTQNNELLMKPKKTKIKKKK